MYDSDTALLTDNQYLINAAKKNYNLFLTPTSLVTAKKVKRYYTPAEQADLDIKTSVNKIGEIINLSQELNSLLWERLYYGAAYSKIEELYFDICQLDVMSGIEIDKAKKEFDVDNIKELDKLRRKYKGDLTCEDSRKRMPHFFAHVARQKGYYNPTKKNYSKYHTSMDYLQTIVNSFRVKHPYRKEYQPISCILNRDKYYNTNINHTQVDRLYEMVHNFISARQNLFMKEKTLENDNRYIVLAQLKEDLEMNFARERIGYSTVFHLIGTLNDEKYNLLEKRIMLELLLQFKNESFINAILESRENIKELLVEQGDDIQIFGINFAIKPVKANAPARYINTEDTDITEKIED